MTQTLTIHKTRQGLNNQTITLCGAKDDATYLPHLAECSSHDRKGPCNCTVRRNCEACEVALTEARQRQAAAAKRVIAAGEEKMAQLGDDIQIFD